MNACIQATAVNNRAGGRHYVCGLMTAVTLSLSACATIAEQRVEQSVLDALPRMLGPGDYDVDVSGVGNRNGDIVRVERAHAVGEWIARRGAPVIDRIEIDLEGVRVNQQDETLESVEAADARLWVKAEDVAAFLERRLFLEAVTVAFDTPDQASLSARPVIPGLALRSTPPMALQGRLVPRASELLIRVADMRMGDFTSGSLLSLMLEQAVNPLIDLSTLPVPACISGVRVDGDTLIVSALGGHPRGGPPLKCPAPTKSRMVELTL